MDDARKAPDITRRHTGILLLVVAVVAVVLRMWGLDQESVWWDEYTSLAHMDAPSLGAFHELNRLLDPAALPLYYSLEYLWWNYVSASEHSLRLLSIGISLWGIPLIYGAGATLFNRRAGIVAAMCLALSPVHIYHAQGIRMYVLFAVLALASLYTFSLLITHGKRQYWIAHIVANFLLTWTHPFGLLIFAVEGITLLATRPRAVRMWIPWGIANVVLTLPMIAYLKSVSYWSAESTQDWFEAPPFVRFLADVFADDVVNWTYQLREVAEPMSYFPGGTALLRVAGPLGSVALALLFAGALVFAILAARRVVRLRPKLVLLLLWIILPPSTLYLASLAWRPCIFPRYTLYGCFGVYLLLGAMISMLSPAKFRMAFALTIALFAVQITLLHPGAQRTDWKNVAAHIKENTPESAVTLVVDHNLKSVLAYNLDDPARMISSAKDKDEAVAITAWLAQSPDQSLPVNLAVAGEYEDSAGDIGMETRLAALGLNHTRHVFPGVRYVSLYEIAATGASGVPEIPEDRKESLGWLAVALVKGGKTGRAREILSVLTRTSDEYGLRYQNLAKVLAEGRDTSQILAALDATEAGLGAKHNGNPALAIRLLSEAVEYDPASFVALDSMFRLQVKLGRYDDAMATYRMMKPHLPTVFAALYAHLDRVRERGRDIPAALDALLISLNAMQKVFQGDPTAESGLLAALDRDPGLGIPHYGLAAFKLAQGDRPGFWKEMKALKETAPEFSALVHPFAEAVFVRQDAIAADRVVKDLEAEGVPLPQPFMRALEDLKARGTTP